MFPLRWKKRDEKYRKERTEFFRAIKHLDRRTFLKVSGMAGAVFASKGLIPPHSFQMVDIVHAKKKEKPQIRFAYISDIHLYEHKLSERFVRAIMRAVQDVSALDPQPDFVFFGGDLAQLGQPGKPDLRKQILSEVKAPVKMMIGEHDWFLGIGKKWQQIFGPSQFYKYYKPWNFWTDDAEAVQKILFSYKSVTVIHGHTHQMLTNRIKNIHFHELLSTAWP